MIDPQSLERFVEAQRENFEQAKTEIQSGRKRSHWMWYVFPQIHGLGSSTMAQRYAIRSLAEAEAYLAHPVLGPRLVDCSTILLEIEGRTAHEIFGSPDDLKLKSSATLFMCVSPPGSVFEQLLDKYFRGERDSRTLSILGLDRGAAEQD